MAKIEEKMAHNEKTCKVWATSLEVKVRFACRLFFESSSRGNYRKSKQIRIDPKQNNYSFNEYLFSFDSRLEHLQSQKQPHKVAVKLLSNRGLEFTAGIIVIEGVPTHSQMSQYEVSKTADIEVKCSIKFQYCRDEGTIIGKLDDIQEEAQETSKLQDHSPDTKEQHISHAVLPQYSKISEKIRSPPPRREYPRKYSQNHFKKQLPKDQHIQYLTTDRKELKSSSKSSYPANIQSQGYNHLLQKQREMIEMLQKKYRECLHQEERLKIHLSKNEIELQRKRQKINELQEEKIRLMTDNMEKDKHIGTFKGSLRKVLEKTERDIGEVLTQMPKNKQKKIVEYKLTDSTIKKEEVESETPLKLLEKEPIETQSQECSEMQNYNDLSWSVLNQIKEEPLLPTRKVNLSQISSEHDLCECLNDLSWYLSRITTKIQKFSSSICLKLLNLSKSNSTFKSRLVQSRQQFETNEQSLFSYLQQLQTSLERQLQLVNEKEQVILGYLSLIQDLNDKIVEHENRIAELEEGQFRLSEQNQFVKSQLHENNYLFSIKEDEYMKKIQALQSNLNRISLGQNIRSAADLIGPFSETSQDNEDSNSLLGEYCQRIRDKEMELHYQKKQKLKLIQKLTDKEDELRSALMQKRKLEFAIKLKNKLSGSEKDIDKSFELSEEEIRKRNFIEEQFLGVLT